MKTLKKLTMATAVLLSLSVLFFAGCKKSDNGVPEGMTRMKVRMIDAPSPYNYQAINIDVQGLQVKIDDEWQTMPIKPGIHNILELVNGSDVELADVTVPMGTVNEIRLILGNNNTINVNGQLRPLTLRNDAMEGLTVDLDEPVSTSEFLITVDFDAAHSISALDDGTYELHPVLHVFTAEATGSLSGQVLPAGSGIAIIAIGHNWGHDFWYGGDDDDDEGDDDDDGENHWWDWYHSFHHHHYHGHHNGNHCGYQHDDDVLVYSAYADAETGGFLIQGMEPGEYTIKVYPADDEVAVVYYNVTITEGGTASLGSITLP